MERSREDFRREYEVPSYIKNDIARRQHYDNRSARSKEQVQYKGRKGQARQKKNAKKKARMRTIAALLAASIGIGGAAYKRINSENDMPTITQLEQSGENISKLGLGQETIQMMEQYDQYFEEFDPKASYGLSEESVNKMISDLDTLHKSIIKEKMGDVKGIEASNIELHYDYEKYDGWMTTIVLHKDKYNEIIYTSSKGQIPTQLSQGILQLDKLETLQASLKGDKISKINAVKELKKLYANLEKIATSEFLIDAKDKISLVEYSKEKQSENYKQGGER